MIVADTNVVSEFMRDQPAPEVVSWAHTVHPRELAISVITMMEIEFGVGRLPEGRRRADLHSRWLRLNENFGEQFLPFDVAAARTTAELLADAERSGRPMGLADAQIAGTCVARGARLATRNTKDFQGIPGLSIIVP